MIFGIKEKIPYELASDLRTTGVYWVVAVAGLHINIFAGFIKYIFSIFLRRQIALFVSIFSVLFYEMLAGFSPSVVRAGFMIITVFASQILGRQIWSSYSLFLTAFLMLFFSPGLLFDVGFQLSFLATAGLIYIKPVTKNKLFDSLQATLFAQTATLPVIVSNFGIYSIWSTLVNILVVWTLPICMALGGLASIFSFFEPLGKVFLLLALPLLSYFEEIVKNFSSFGGVIKFDSLSLPIILGYYLLLLSFILVRKK